MKTQQLIDQTRKQSDDVSAAAALWDDDDIALSLSEAESDACIRAKLIRDQVTDTSNSLPVSLVAITTCAVTPDTPTGFNYAYTLHPSVFLIDGAWYVDNKLPLAEVPKDQFMKDRWTHRYGYGYGTPGIFGDYNTASAGRASAFWPDSAPDESLIMRLLPLPNASTYVDTAGNTQPIQIRLSVYRTPLAALSAELPDATPEINARHHYNLIYGALARMFLRRDLDTYDPKNANKFAAMFTEKFGAPVDANITRQRHEYRRNRTRFRMLPGRGG